MRVPDGLSDAWRSQIDLTLAWFVQGEIFGAQLERVAASAFGRDLQYDVIMTEMLRSHFEVEDAIRTQVDPPGRTVALVCAEPCRTT
jgi:hypothetical protein